MEINDYKGIVNETAIFPTKVDNFGLAYAWLGLLDETEEFWEKKLEYVQYDTNPTSEQVKELKKELGDCCWYTMAICQLEDLDYDKVFNIGRVNSTLKRKTVRINSYNGTIKKYYRDNKSIDKTELENILTINLFIMLFSLNIDVDLGEILKINYDKLIDRKNRDVIKGDGDNR